MNKKAETKITIHEETNGGITTYYKLVPGWRLMCVPDGTRRKAAPIVGVSVSYFDTRAKAMKARQPTLKHPFPGHTYMIFKQYAKVPVMGLNDDRDVRKVPKVLDSYYGPEPSTLTLFAKALRVNWIKS